MKKTVEHLLARLRGTADHDVLSGRSDTSDIFDGDAGGNDKLHGKGGNDVYWLGYGTGHDVVNESVSNLSGDSGDEIRMKEDIVSSDVRLRRVRDNLVVELRGSDGVVGDSLTVLSYFSSDNAKVERLLFSDGTVWGAAEFAVARIHGTANHDVLSGRSDTPDIFDGDAGGNDKLQGKGGNDVYWLGYGTGHDVVNESVSNLSGDSGDEIRIKSGIVSSDVRLRRVRDNLVVELRGLEGVVGDSLTVLSYFSSDNAKVERLVFSNKTVWGAEEFAAARIHGTANHDVLSGRSDTADIFDGDAGGNDKLQGKGGNDVYWLGYGTGHDVVNESVSNLSGDSGDEIRIKSGIVSSDVRLRRVRDNLVVELRGLEGVVGDSLTVLSYFSSDNAKVERLVFSDGTEWGAEEFAAARIDDTALMAELPGEVIRGTANNDSLYGDSKSDIFDGNAGGNDMLFGRGGNDVYWLGYGTGHDIVYGATGDEIRIKSGINLSDVRLRRGGRYDNNLVVQLLDENGVVSDSLTVQFYFSSDNAKVERLLFANGTEWGAEEFAAARIHGTVRDEALLGRSDMADVFDSDAGGNDRLYGGSGNDVYWLGYGTGHDVVNETRIMSSSGTYYYNDVDDEIRIKAGITSSDVRLWRRGGNYVSVPLGGGHLSDDLVVQLRNGNGVVDDSLTVNHYFSWDVGKVERLLFSDGTEWGAAEFAAARIYGAANNDLLYGSLGNTSDIFDSDAGGNDRLYGRGGDDVYWLGYGTGHDIVYEFWSNSSGDAGDEIRIKSGITPSDVLLRRANDDIVVQLRNANGVVGDSLTVKSYFSLDSAKVEKLLFADGTEWGAAEFAAADRFATTARMHRGTANNDVLYGDSDMSDIFDGDVGGDDILYGYGGDDVYWLGYGTGHDTVEEYSHTSFGDEIRIKDGITPSDVRLRRLRVDLVDDLVVQLLDENGIVSDSLTVKDYFSSNSANVERLLFADGTEWGAEEFAAAGLYGTANNDHLQGSDGSDVFDSDAGGNDSLSGGGGDDVYWLGYGTGHDTVFERRRRGGAIGANDEIRIKSGITPSDIRLRRGPYNRLFVSSYARDLVVELRNANGVVSDSLTVNGYFSSDSAKVEKLLFADGTEWGAAEFAAARRFAGEHIRGGANDDKLAGHSDTSDIFDGNGGGNDTLYGKGGDDVYWLGYGTGHDIVNEYRSNPSGDSGDEIRIKSGITLSDVRLRRVRDNLVVRLLDSGGIIRDSLTVKFYFSSDNAKVEKLVFSDGTEWGTDEFAELVARIYGTANDDRLYGRSDTADVFDGNAGGNDRLYGKGGDDVYWLGYGTGHDIVHERLDNPSGDTSDEIRIKPDIAPSNVSLRREGDNLVVRLLDENGVAGDSLTVHSYFSSDNAKVERLLFANGTEWGAEEFAAARIHGTVRDEALFGRSDMADIFDGDAGGNDRLYGRGGDDVYWLGYGTGHDIVHERLYNPSGDTGDEIRIKPDITPADVRLRRDGDNLVVRLLDENGVAGDSLTVQSYFSSDNAKVEKLLFADGTEWGAEEFAAARIHGTVRDEALFGRPDTADVFDGDAGGDDRLYGRGGDDVYWLGYGTGRDSVNEYWHNPSGDAGDEIRIKPDITPADVRLRRVRNNLVVELQDGNGVVGDSLTVREHFSLDNAKVESIHIGDRVLLSNQYQMLIDEISAFEAGGSRFADMDALNAHFWRDEETLGDLGG